MGYETLFVNIKAIDQFSGTFAKVKAQSATAGSGFAGMGRAGLVAAAAGVVLAGALVSCAKEAMAAEANIAKTESIIKTTGGTANVTSDDIGELAMKVRDYSGYTAGAVRSAANMMLTFRDVRNEVGAGNDIFDQAVEAAVDLSRMFNIDMTQASKQLGKALNDPIAGVTALKRMGVSLNATQKETVKNFMEQGNIMGAQKVILGEINKEVGDVAEAYGKTLAGKVEIARAKLVSMKVAVGNLVIANPLLTKSVDRVAGAFDNLSKAFNSLPIKYVKQFFDLLNKGPFGGKDSPGWMTKLNTHVVKPLISGVTHLIPVVGPLIGMWDSLGMAADKTSKKMKESAPDASPWRGIVGVMDKITASFDNGKRAAKEYSDAVKESLSSISGEVNTLEQALGEKGLIGVTNRSLKAMLQGFQSASPAVRDEAYKMMESILEAESRANPKIAEKAGEIMDNIKLKIEQLPAGEKTAKNMNDIIKAEIAAAGPISAEMQSIMDRLRGILLGTDFYPITAGIAKGIQQAFADNPARPVIYPPEVLFDIQAVVSGVTSGIQQAFNNNPVHPVVRNIHQGGAVQHQGGKVMHGGGMTDEVNTTLQKGEYVINRKAVKQVGVRTLNAINRGDVGGGGPTIVLQSTFSMASDSEMRRAAKKLNKYLALEGAR